MRHRLPITARSILLGWVTLFAVTYLVERPLIVWTAPLVGAPWIPTAQLALECIALAATGWVMGHWNQLDAIRAVLVFAAMLAVWDFGLVPAINVQWLFRLIVNAFGDARYLESLVTSVVTHALLFGSLIVGARLSRPPQPPVSLAGG
jgi:hypothetical protein